MTMWGYIIGAAALGLILGWVARVKVERSLDTGNDMGRCVKIDYTNWRGERRQRVIDPVGLEFKKSAWHEKQQWFITAFDGGEGENADDLKDFALTNIHQWIDDAAEGSESNGNADAKGTAHI